MRLRYKFTIALLITSLLSSAMVGGIAHFILMQNFHEKILEEAFENFHNDVSAYLRTYGSWENGLQAEPFRQFAQRQRPAHPPMQFVHDDDRGLLSKPPLPPIHNRKDAPPFLFMLVDLDGVVVKPGPGFQSGQQINDTLKASALPIYVDDQVRLLAVPLGDPNLTKEDQAYLTAIKNALQYGLLGAAFLAVVLGLLFGQRISSAIDRLTESVRTMRPNGELANPINLRSKDEIGELAQAFNRMSVELSYAHNEMKELTIRDPLTHLYNRRHFNEQAEKAYEQACRYNQPLSVVIADLDHFKSINDSFSHGVGDEVLKEVAEIMQQNIRKSDVLARFGGEEFVILLPQTSLQEAIDCCENLRNKIEEGQQWRGINPDLSVTLSIGVCDQVDLGSIEKMLNIADLALYQAKRKGRNRVWPSAA